MLTKIIGATLIGLAFWGIALIVYLTDKHKKEGNKYDE
jgi:hypothetical protein